MKMTKEQFHNIFPNRTEYFYIEHYLYRKNEQTIIIQDKINLILYLLLIIPAILANFFICVWDGGLKTYQFPYRTIRTDSIQKGWDTTTFEKLLNILEKKD